VRVADRLRAHALADRWRAALHAAAHAKGDVVLGGATATDTSGIPADK
jgi:hypothetical protein